MNYFRRVGLISVAVCLAAIVGSPVVLARMTPPTSAIVVKPRPVPAVLAGRRVAYTYESQITKALIHRVDPVYAGPTPGPRRQVGVVQIYVDAHSGKVIYADVLDAPDRAHGDALKRAVYQWTFAKALGDEVLSSPITFYFLSVESGKTAVVRAQ